MDELADAPVVAIALTVLGALVLCVVGLGAMLVKFALQVKDIEARDITRERNTYRSMALQAVGALEAVANRERRGQGLGLLPIVAPVVAEHNSPPTAIQQEAADIATLRARLVVATDALGLPPRGLEDVPRMDRA